MPTTLNTSEIAQVSGARTTTLQIEDFATVREISIVDRPDFGTLTVNPDNSLALVMTHSDHTGPLDFTVEITDENGNVSQQTFNIDVTPPSQQGGWGTGSNHYMLETDAQGELVIETGQNHREVYVSASADALTIADIAAQEGLQTWQITGEWLANNPEYGSDENNALAQDAGMLLWQELTGRNFATGEEATPSSHWLRLESGYVYDQIADNGLMPAGIQGESPLHPVVITSYGDGAQPVLANNHWVAGYNGETFSNIVIHDLNITQELLFRGSTEGSGNIIVDSVTATDMGWIVVEGADSFTLRDSNMLDTGPDAPRYGSSWSPHLERFSGSYFSDVQGLLVEGTRFTGIGWDEGYDYNGRGDRPQPPSTYSHSIYVQHDVLDLTFRDNISAAAASMAAQLRSGGFIEDNLLMDSGGGLIFRGGEYWGEGPIGNFSLVAGNVITAAGYRSVAEGQGYHAMGIYNGGNDTTLIGNIVAHLADPNDPQELAERSINEGGLVHEHSPYYDDTMVYRWYGSWHVDRGIEEGENQNIEGLDRSVLDQTTADNLAKIMLNDPNADIDDLVAWIGQTEIEAETLNAYFQQAFGILEVLRTDPREVQFVPNELGDGVRWDNRMNWDTNDIAGSVANDLVNLGGNHVTYGGTHTILGLDFGDGGRLDVSNGRLNVIGQTTSDTWGGQVDITNAGQFWMHGYNGAGTLSITQDGGRFANTGAVVGNVDVVVESGQAILSADGGLFAVGSDYHLHIEGADALVGFDGDAGDTGIIRFDTGACLTFASDQTGLGRISEFRSGAFGDNPDVTSQIDLGYLHLTIDLTQAYISDGAYLLMSADQVTGLVGSFEVIGVGARSATVTVDYQSDEVWLNLGGGSGVSIETIGLEQPDDSESFLPIFCEGDEGFHHAVGVDGGGADAFVFEAGAPAAVAFESEESQPQAFAQFEDEFFVL
ncbi:hypothetical protein [Tateyamaria sp. syn59]|uniref:hypothetical protein n=1 Tax=Tateyamaria sp. syn59 TaxID=2576942 RepID=UPI0011BEC562|nr:hypothetical protein [Tateyamaria sp. syn59]